ncbi:MAG TPA: isochorismatase family protein [Myxococcota bacterium]|nr:isochorismatase family protein [Myxococcota bacterium]
MTRAGPERSDLALLVIDVQQGAFDGVRCPAIAGAAELVANVTAALAAARAAGAAVVFVQHSEPGGVFDAATPQFELHEALDPAPNDVRITKRQSSSFAGTRLADALARLGAREVLLCGLQSEHCVYHTALGALERGLRTTLVSDAHATWPTATECAAAISARINGELQRRGAKLCATRELDLHTSV